MPFARPIISDLVNRIRGDLRGRLEITGPLVRRAMVDVLGSAWGGGLHEVYGNLDWLSRQLFVLTAEREALLRRAASYGITPTPASFATGSVIATGINGNSVLADTIIRLDETTTYRVTTGGTISGGAVTLPVAALVAGAASNLPSGATLSFENPILGVDPSVTITGIDGIDGGEDEEDTEGVRARLLLRLRKPPAGGSEQDYESWALAVPGVTRAWVFGSERGRGTVVVRFVLDESSPIFPDGTAVAAVQSALDAKRPITAVAIAVAPTQLSVAFTIHLVPDNADTRAAVAAELGDLMTRIAEPGDGAGRGTVLLSQIRTSIGVADGVTNYTLTMPSADVVPATGQLPTLGTITWT